MKRRLLTIGHSYVVSENRRLAHEMGVQGRNRWEVVAIAPERFRGDLGPLHTNTAEAEALELRTLPVRLGRSVHLMRYAGLREAMAGSWDVVHAWEEPYIAAGAQIAATAPTAAKVVFATFQNIAKQYPWPLSSFERQSMRRVDGWIAFGELVKTTLASLAPYGGKPSRVIPPGVDTGLFRHDAAARAVVRRELGWAEAAPVVGFLGRFEPQKGIELLCGALEAVPVPWHALFVGGGALEARLRTFEKRHPSRVRVITGVSHREVPRWLNAMSLLCAPSQTTRIWREQFGRMLIEAMACAVPVVGSDSGEIPFVIGEAGVILPEADPLAWTAAIERLLSDPAARCTYADSGVARVAERFTWPVVARAHLAWFDELLG